MISLKAKRRPQSHRITANIYGVTMKYGADWMKKMTPGKCLLMKIEVCCLLLSYTLFVVKLISMVLKVSSRTCYKRQIIIKFVRKHRDCCNICFCSHQVVYRSILVSRDYFTSRINSSVYSCDRNFWIRERERVSKHLPKQRSVRKTEKQEQKRRSKRLHVAPASHFRRIWILKTSRDYHLLTISIILSSTSVEKLINYYISWYTLDYRRWPFSTLP